jgi:hypothetical protein
VSIKGSLSGDTVGDESINDYVLPLPVLEELKHGKSLIYTVMNNQILEQLGLLCQKHERTEQPAVSQKPLLHISRLNSVYDHFRLFSLIDFLRTFPFDNNFLLGVLWRV